MEEIACIEQPSNFVSVLAAPPPEGLRIGWIWLWTKAQVGYWTTSQGWGGRWLLPWRRVLGRGSGPCCSNLGLGSLWAAQNSKGPAGANCGKAEKWEEWERWGLFPTSSVLYIGVEKLIFFSFFLAQKHSNSVKGKKPWHCFSKFQVDSTFHQDDLEWIC